MSELHLLVGGRRYQGWKSVRVTRSMESLAGSFDLGVSDRWAHQEVPWPIAEEDECRIEIDGEQVIDGFVERRSLAFDATSRTLGYGGRDRAAAIVDCSALLERWTFRRASVLDVARAVAAPFGVKVSVQPGLVLPKPPAKLVVSPGETGWAVLERAAQMSEVLAISDGAGGIVLTRAGQGRADALVQGQNILAASVDYDGANRFGRYVVMTQIGGTDTAAGGATRIRSEATDEGVRRKERALVIRPDSGITQDYARQRADWEARVRAAKAEAVSVTVRGWRQASGDGLWPINATCYVRAPAVGVDGDLLISQVQFALDDQGEIAQLRLVRPDAFTPEPREAKVKSSGQRWKELAGGAR